MLVKEGFTEVNIAYIYIFITVFFCDPLHFGVEGGSNCFLLSLVTSSGSGIGFIKPVQAENSVLPSFSSVGSPTF